MIPKKKFLLLCTMICMTLLATSIVSAITLPEQMQTADPECATVDPATLLSGDISTDGTTGIVTNTSPYNCAFDVGMASYEKFDEIIDNQQLFASDTATGIMLAPNESTTLSVAVPACATQIDLFVGSVLISLNGQRYGDRLLDAIHVGGDNYCVDGVDDADNDTILDVDDNCPFTPNPGQENLDGDAEGDVCDDDVDGDLYLNINDCAPRDPLINPGATEIPNNGIDENCDASDLVIGSGDVQITLTWDNADDLDLHVFEPNGTHIWFANRGPTATGGVLDFDSNVGCVNNGAVENVFWPAGSSPEGTYQVEVRVYSECGAPLANWRLVVNIAGVGTVLDESGQGGAFFSFTNGGMTSTSITRNNTTQASVVANTAETRFAHSRANVRVCPALTCDIVDVVNRGEAITVAELVTGDSVDGSTDWWRIVLDGRTLYLHSGLVVESQSDLIYWVAK